MSTGAPEEVTVDRPAEFILRLVDTKASRCYQRVEGEHRRDKDVETM